MDSTTNSFCFAAAPYANAAPLSHFLAAVAPGLSMVEDHPSRLLPLLLDGSADVALLPVADLLANPELTFVRGLGVCARRKVTSVLLRCHRPLTEIRSVAMDPNSKTSNALTGILLRRHFRLAAPMRPASSGQRMDAEVVIGDRALCTAAGGCGDLDLVELWNDMAHLPFVFAVWAHRSDHPRAEALGRIARAAKEAGVAAIEELARSESHRLHLPLERCRDYFRSSIHYDLGPQEEQAMALFGRLIEDPQAAIDPRQKDTP